MTLNEYMAAGGEVVTDKIAAYVEKDVFNKSFMQDSKKLYESKEPVVSKALFDKISAYLTQLRGEN